MIEPVYVKVKKFVKRPEKKADRQARKVYLEQMLQKKRTLKFKRWSTYPFIDKNEATKSIHYSLWSDAGICVKKEFVLLDKNSKEFRANFFGILYESDFESNNRSKKQEMIFHVRDFIL
jgi:hypothetical protein